MKKLLILLFAVTVFGCKKQVSENSLSGTWELRSSTGGMLGNQSFAPGNGTVLIFKSDNYEKFVSKSKTESGTFDVLTDKKTINGDVVNNKIEYSYNGQIRTEYIVLTDDILKIYIGEIAADGVVQEYVKISE